MRLDWDFRKAGRKFVRRGTEAVGAGFRELAFGPVAPENSDRPYPVRFGGEDVGGPVAHHDRGLSPDALRCQQVSEQIRLVVEPTVELRPVHAREVTIEPEVLEDAVSVDHRL